jgi:sugar lactone lactonase YvrE
MLFPINRVQGFSSAQVPAISIGEQRSSSYGVLTPWGGLAIDASGNLWVADSENNRILGFTVPLSDNMSASFVIGQPNFLVTTATVSADGLSFPMYITFDHVGDLWVSDSENSRVLEYTPPFHNGMNASIVIGQGNFTTAFFATARSSLSGPGQIAFDAVGDLWVVDGGNGRVVEYQPPFTTGMNASVVLGEPDFNQRYCQDRTGYDPSCSNHSTLTYPESLAFDPAGNLWVTDSPDINGRLLEFQPPFKNAMQHSRVMQPVFASGIAFDRDGDMWLACGYCYGGGGGDVVEYRPPFNQGSIKWENGLALGAVFYLVSWNETTPMERVLALPTGLAFDSAGNLWVVDARSSWLIGLMGRVVGYDAQIHPLDTQDGRVYFQSNGGLLAPLKALPLTETNSTLFPEGLFNFTIQGLPPHGSVTVKITFAHPLTSSLEWWSKLGAEWSALPANQTSISGNNMTLTLTNATTDGVISVLGGPASSTPPGMPSSETSTASTLVTNPGPSSTFIPSVILLGVGAVFLLAVGVIAQRLKKDRGRAGS